MTTDSSPSSDPGTDEGRRLSTPWIVTILVVLILAVPAAAAVLLESFFRSDVEVAESCFVRTAGADVGASDLIDFDAGATVTDADTGVELLQQVTSLTAHAGGRLLYSEAVVFTNDCGGPITLALSSSDDPAGGAAIDSPEVFDGSIDVTFQLSDPAGDSVIGLPGTWTEALRVTDGVATAGSTVELDAGDSTTLALVVDADASAQPGTTGTLRWVTSVDAG